VAAICFKKCGVWRHQQFVEHHIKLYVEKRQLEVMFMCAI